MIDPIGDERGIELAEVGEMMVGVVVVVEVAATTILGNVPVPVARRSVDGTMVVFGGLNCEIRERDRGATWD